MSNVWRRTRTNRIDGSSFSDICFLSQYNIVNLLGIVNTLNMIMLMRVIASD